MLVSEDEARNTVELDDMYVIQPAHPWWSQQNWKDARPLPDGFRYGSDSNAALADLGRVAGADRSEKLRPRRSSGWYRRKRARA